MTKNRLLFIGGIHGSGKDTYCQKTLSQWYSISASKIIEQKRGIVNTDKTIKKSDVDSNQKHLIQGCQDLREVHAKLAITGHFCLANKNTQEIHKIPLDVFLQIRPTEIIILTALANEIRLRLKKRDGSEWDSDFIRRAQEEELNYGKWVAHELNVPFEIIKN